MSGFWHNKKVIIYVALLHHTRFLIPIARNLENLGAKVEYIVGQAERSQEITAEMCKLKYRHVFEYVSDNDFPEINRNYLKLRKAFRTALLKDYAMGAQVITVLDKTLHATAQEYVGFKNLLKKERPDICLALHELNRWGKMLAFQAKKINIPFITLQEGLGYNLDFGYTGHIQYSTLGLTWGSRIREKLGSYEAPLERIIPVGNTHLAEEKKRLKNNNTQEKMKIKYKLENKFVNLLIFSASPLDVDIVLPLLKVTSESSDLALFIKFHPADKQDRIRAWQDLIEKKLKKNVWFIHGEENTYDLIAMCDLCTLAQPSTTGLEALALGRPLVQLDVELNANVPYSFIRQNAAVGMTPGTLAAALEKGENFSDMIDKENMEKYLKSELTATRGAADRIIHIAEKLIRAGSHTITYPPTLHDLRGKSGYDFKWSMVIPVPENMSDKFLSQLESISNHSENSGEYEVILIRPENISDRICHIIDTLQGNIHILDKNNNCNGPDMMNIAGENARGKILLFFSELLSPCRGWLFSLEKAFNELGTKKIFGGKVINMQGNIIHAGMVLDENNSPVSAYRYLDRDFPKANIRRAFQMLDYFVALDKDFFSELGGFWGGAGENAFMDICLRASDSAINKKDFKNDTIPFYLPDLQMVQLDVRKKKVDFNDSINFFARWHGTLWENRKSLYRKDGVSKTELDAAYLSSTLKSTLL